MKIPLWQPSEPRIKNTNMYRFMTLVNDRFNKEFTEYTGLWEWSVENLEDFWSTAWEFSAGALGESKQRPPCWANPYRC